jgi:hypothetical protein
MVDVANIFEFHLQFHDMRPNKTEALGVKNIRRPVLFVPIVTTIATAIGLIPIRIPEAGHNSGGDGTVVGLEPFYSGADIAAVAPLDRVPAEVTDTSRAGRFGIGQATGVPGTPLEHPGRIVEGDLDFSTGIVGVDRIGAVLPGLAVMLAKKYDRSAPVLANPDFEVILIIVEINVVKAVAPGGFDPTGGNIGRQWLGRDFGRLGDILAAQARIAAPSATESIVRAFTADAATTVVAADLASAVRLAFLMAGKMVLGRQKKKARDEGETKKERVPRFHA